MENPQTSKNKPQKQVVPLREMFEAYCLLDALAEVVDVDLLTFSQLIKWLKSAKITQLMRVTSIDAFLCFTQFRKRAITYQEFLLYLEDLAIAHCLDLDQVKYKMQTCGKPPPPSED